MAIATIELDDGRRVKIEVPDGATQAQIGAFIQQNLGQFAPPQDMAQPSLGRSGFRADSPQTKQEDPFAGLPKEIVSDIEARFPMPTGKRVRQSQKIGVRQNRKKAAELERIRLVNPSLAELIEETGDIESFLIGAGRGLTTIGRAVGLADQEDESVTSAIEGLRSQTPAVSIGEAVGESAPFAAIGGPLSGVAKTGLQRAALGGALGGAEAAAITRGQGGTAEETLKSAAIGTALGSLGGLVPSGRSRAATEELLDTPNREIVRELSEAAPSINQLKDASRSVYQEIDDLGVTLKPSAVENLTLSIRQGLEDSGLDAINTPKAFRAVKRLEDLIGEQPTLRQIDQIRETAQAAASDIANKKEASLGVQFIDRVDEFLDNLQPSQFDGAVDDLGSKYKQARDLWGRARRSELIEEAFIDAEDQASGFENGIRIAFRKILRNKKQRKFFTKDEIAEMQKVVRGTKAANLAKLVGKLGISEGNATNFLGGSIGAFGGASIFGPAGAVIVPGVGQFSKQFAQKLTKGNADFANAIIRAGKDGKKIVAEYIKNTPKAQRDPDELAQLLMRPKVDLSNIQKTPIANLAVDKANALRKAANDALQAAPVAAGVAAGSVAAEDQNGL